MGTPVVTHSRYHHIGKCLLLSTPFFRGGGFNLRVIATRKFWFNSFRSQRYQPRTSTPTYRRRRRLIVRIAVIAAAIFFFTVFVWPGSSIASIFSFEILSTIDDFELESVRYYDLTNVEGTARGWEREERILLCVPLRDAESHLAMFLGHLRNFTYPHHLIDLAFLVSDSKDKTLEVLSNMLEDIQADEDPEMHYGEISIIEKDFGQKVNQDVESRHGFAAQAGRRKLMAQARNWLLSAALRPYHSWVYWRDVDVETAPFTILEDLMRHNKDVIVPSEYIRTILCSLIFGTKPVCYILC
jgi:mannan polymerase II complex ANP1 subunit